MIEASKRAVAAVLFVAATAHQAAAATLTVCNKLSESVTGVQLSGGVATPDADARVGVVAPNACAHWTVAPQRTYAIHYILGKDNRVMLCAITAQTADATTIEISPSNASCIR